MTQAGPDVRPFRLAAPIRTARLELRAFRSGDLEALASYRSREDITRFLYWEPQRPEQVRATLEGKIAATSITQEGDFLALAAELRETGQLLGDVVLHFVSGEHGTGEIGFLFHPDHHGKGFATEASEPLLRIAFEEMNLHRVIGRLEARNIASARVLEKLGMRREAHLVENEFVKGEWQSELDYAILAREWRAARRATPPA